MNKSVRLQSALTAAAVAVPLALAGCTQAPEVTSVDTYKTVDDCIAAGVYSADVCQTTQLAAAAIAEDKTPYYDTQKQCEDDWGKDDCNTGPATAFNQSATPDAVYYPFLYGWGINSKTKEVTPVYGKAKPQLLNGEELVSTEKPGRMSVTKESFNASVKAGPRVSLTEVESGIHTSITRSGGFRYSGYSHVTVTEPHISTTPHVTVTPHVTYTPHPVFMPHITPHIGHF